MIRRAAPIVLAVTSLLFLAPGRAGATSWYVDNTASGGAKNGTSWANAWTSFASVAWSSIQPGDTLYISGGSTSQTYTESWTISRSGSAAQPIVISAGQDAGHNGLVTFDYNADGDSSTRTAITINQDYITLTGNVSGANHIQIVNLRNTSDRRSSVGIAGTSNTGVIVDHVTFLNDNNPIRFDYANGVTVRNCSFVQLRGDAGIAMNASAGTWDNNQIYGNYIEPMVDAGVGGPDGIQGASGISIYNNTVKEVTTSTYTSTQHPDMMQITGDYIKVYNNDFINVGDSVFDHDCYADSNPHDIWIYNNTFRIVTTIDIYPEYFRLYASSGSVSSLTNIKLFNNTFIDNNYSYGRVIRFDSFNGNPTASGIELKNNIWYNAGNNAPGPALWIDDSTGFTSSSFSLDYNIYYQSSGSTYIQFRGASYTAASWIASHEPHSKTAQPLFVSYAPSGTGNDLHLQSSDSAAKDAGVSLSSYFTTDHDGVIRPQGPGWDIGAFEASVSSSGPLPPTSPLAIVR